MLHAEVGLQLGTLALDATLDAKAGEIVVLLGPNGAGKTTLLRAIAGLTPLARGEVTLDGAVLDDVARGVHVPAERRPIGVVFQEYLLFPHQTVAENVGFGLRARGVDRVHARARALEWLDRFELAAYADARPRSLSGGQAQRVALARALAYTPRLLLLDEPLAALDASARGEVRRDLKRHLASFDGIRVLITHDPLEAIALADRLVILEEGRVVQTGTPSDVTQRPRTRYVADLVGVNLFRGRAKAGLISLESGSTLQSAEELEFSLPGPPWASTYAPLLDVFSQLLDHAAGVKSAAAVNLRTTQTWRSFFGVLKQSQTIVPALGEVQLDIAYGGNFYGIVPAQQVGLALDKRQVPELVSTGMKIMEAVEEQVYQLQNSDRRHFHDQSYTPLQHDEWLHDQL